MHDFARSALKLLLLIVAFACIRTLIMYKCCKFGICLESARNVISQQIFFFQKVVLVECSAKINISVLTVDAASKMNEFQTTMEEMVPGFTPYKTLEQPTKLRCAMWCQQEVDCVTFAARQLSTGSITCLMYDRRPLTFDHQPEAGVVTMELVKTVYI